MSRAKFVLIANQKGGCGKTTLTVHLAAWLQKQGKSVVVIDPDNQRGVQTWLKSVSPSIGVLAIASLDELEAAYPKLVEACDYIVADSSPGLGPITLRCAQLSDLLVIPTLPTGLDIRATQQAISVFTEIGRARGRAVNIRLVINRSPSHRTHLGEASQVFLSSMGQPVAKTRIRDRDAIGQVSYILKAVWDIRKDRGAKEATEDFESLARELFHEDFDAGVGSGTEGPGGSGAADGGDAGCAREAA